MPRDGSTIFHKPFPDVVHDTTIESAVYNGFVNDIESDLNNPRPILSGGTAANNARDALLNLKGEIALQFVENYATHPWVNGSFFSNSGATGAPLGSTAFVGEYYQNLAGDHATIHARANTPIAGQPFGKMYIKQKIAGVWQSVWTIEDAPLDLVKVNRAGDVMTGDLAIDKANPALILDKAATGEASYILAQAGALARWRIDLGNVDAESAPQTGSNFTIRRYTNTGVPIDTPFSIARANGAVTIPTSLIVSGTFSSIGVGSATFAGPLSAPSISTSGTLSVTGAATLSSGVTAAYDVITYRAGSPTTGYVFYGNTGGKYLGFNGTQFDMVGGGFTVHNGHVNASTSISAGTSLAVGTTMSVGGASSYNGLTTHNGGSTIIANGSFASAAYSSFIVQGAYPTITFLYPGVLAMNMSMNSDGHMYIGGGSYGGSYWKIWTTRDFASISTAYVTSSRWVHAGDYQIPQDWAMHNPFGAHCMVSDISHISSYGGVTGRYRYLQEIINGGAYTVGAIS